MKGPQIRIELDRIDENWDWTQRNEKDNGRLYLPNSIYSFIGDRRVQIDLGDMTASFYEAVLNRHMNISEFSITLQMNLHSKTGCKLEFSGNIRTIQVKILSKQMRYIITKYNKL